MESGHTAKAAFRTTHWTQVLEAANSHAQPDGEAFADLYRAYWYPLYAYVRRRGLSPADAEDLTQDFFAHLVSKQSLSRLQREGGKFRSFLLQSMEYFLANEWRRGQAQKRGGGQCPISLNAEAGEARFALEISDEESPASAFEKRWAFTLLENATERLRSEYTALNKGPLFEQLVDYLQPGGTEEPYAARADRCDMSEGAFKVAVHRMRHRYGELLRQAIACTVGSAAEVDEELRYLVSVVGR